MKVAVVTYHLPHPAGTATGRHVFAVWEAVRAMGHEVRAWSWGTAPPGLEPPAWVEQRPFHDPGGWRGKPATVRRPRWGLASVGWQPPSDAVAWAEEPESYAAIDGAARRVLTVPHSALLDAVALRRVTPATVQSVRAERRAVRRSDAAVTLSARLAAATGAGHVLPVTQPMPDHALPLVSEPVAALLADWAWPPNQVALHRLLRAWPVVRREVPQARLLLAGRNLSQRVAVPGVEVVGEVGRPAEVMARAAVFAFPCPATSGPKLKVLDALAHGLPVLTTPGGAEGLDLPDHAAVVVPAREFSAALARLLLDPARRGALASAGRAAALTGHDPQRAAELRLQVLERLP